MFGLTQHDVVLVSDGLAPQHGQGRREETYEGATMDIAAATTGRDVSPSGHSTTVVRSFAGEGPVCNESGARDLFAECGERRGSVEEKCSCTSP